MQVPATGPSIKLENSCRLVGKHAYAESIQIERQAAAKGFDKCLFSSPAIEKSAQKPIARQCAQLRYFVQREKLLCNQECVRHRPHRFQINTDFPDFGTPTNSNQQAVTARRGVKYVGPAC